MKIQSLFSLLFYLILDLQICTLNQYMLNQGVFFSYRPTASGHYNLMAQCLLYNVSAVQKIFVYYIQKLYTELK